MLAAYTTLPIIGIPIKSDALDGLDAMLSTIMMPPGVPVATVAIDGCANAAILAAQIMSLKYDYLKDMLKAEKQKMVDGVNKKNEKIKETVNSL